MRDARENRTIELQHLLKALLLMVFGIFLVQANQVGYGGPTHASNSSSVMVFANVFCAAGLVSVFILLHIALRVWAPTADPYLLPVMVILSGIGLIILLRLSPELAKTSSFTRAMHEKLSFMPLGYWHFLHIRNAVIVSVFGLWIMSRQRFFPHLSSTSYRWVVLAMVWLLATMMFGEKVNGRRLWLGGFQTVEAVKILAIFFLAGYIYDRGIGIDIHRTNRWRLWFRYAWPLLAAWLVSILLLIVQGDIGPMALLFILFLSVFFIAGGRHLVTFSIMILTLAAVVAAYYTGYPSTIVRHRVDILLDPIANSEVTVRTLWAIAEGGWLGTGIGYGNAFRIPVVQSDFNFVVICQEMGWIGGITVLAAYAILVQRCFSIAAKLDNAYKKTIVFGIGVIMATQAIVIIGVNLNFLPPTGITLPFISWGGSSMVVGFLMVCIVLMLSQEVQS
ncbi:MAG: FtsW/RodA/SpoVE family cell cycle protein [Syntrophales bacterium]|jgi:peptidoglycan glycosyltransferase